MTFQIGFLRLDTIRYSNYVIYFHDISGLSKKADIQIAGVRVGWVSHVELVNNGQQVRAEIMILKEYTIYNNAYGIIRQDGLLGSKYVEIIPGDPLLSTIKAGGILMRPSKDPVSVDEIMSEFQDIARNLNAVTKTFKEVLAGDIGTQRLERAIDGFNDATANIAEFSRAIDGVINRNEQAFGDIITDLRSFSHDLKDEFPGLSNDLRDSMTRFSTSVEDAARPIGEVVEKINNGEGVIGSLIADETVSRNLREAISGVKDYFETVDRLAIIFDTHVESMYGLGNKMDFEDAKGYFNVRIHPVEDYFYLIGLVGSYSGRIIRTETYRQWYQNDGCELLPENSDLDSRDKLRFAPNVAEETREFDRYLLNLQFGKIFDDIAFRTGLMDGTFGVGVDFDIPFTTDAFRWVITLEAFDFYGRNRIDDTRVHLKWLNKVFFSESLYFVFGADDFISHTNKNAFFGAGFRFADDDVKYYASRFSLPG
jgi:phospholipid/cholesterol/gamma-HCH transport system substrate-binding protein